MVKESISLRKEILPIFLMGCLFVIIHGLALIIIGLFEPAFTDSGDPMNLVVFFTIIIVAKETKIMYYNNSFLDNYYKWRKIWIKL